MLQAYSVNKKDFKQDQHACNGRQRNWQRLNKCFWVEGSQNEVILMFFFFILWSGYVRQRAMKKYLEEPSAFQIISDNFERKKDL